MIFSIICTLLLSIVTMSILFTKIDGKYNYMNFIGFVYFICFVFAPACTLTAYKLDIPVQYPVWMHFIDDDLAVLYAIALAMLSYLCVASGYSIVRSIPNSNTGNNVSELNKSDIKLIGILLLLAGLAAFFLYQKSMGGISNLIIYAGAIRSGYFPVKGSLAFLKNFLPLILLSSYIFYGLMVENCQDKQSKIVKSLFFLSFSFSMLVIYHVAGRLNLIVYLLVFIVSREMLIKSTSLKVKLAVFIFAFIFIIIGKELFMVGLDAGALESRLDYIGQNFMGAIADFVFEISFPFANIANMTLYNVPQIIEFRWFSDFLLAVAYLVPKRIFEVDLPHTISMLNTSIYGTSGTIPVDFVSFGYISAGAFGVIITSFLFGCFIRTVETQFKRFAGPLFTVLQVVWAFVFLQIIMYGDPVIVLQSNFSLILGTVLIIMFALFRNRRTGSYMISST